MSKVNKFAKQNKQLCIFSLDALSSDYVARYAIDGLEKEKFYIVPGMTIKLLKFFSKIVPANILARMVYLSQKRKKDV